MPGEKEIDRLLEEFRGRTPLRAKSLIVTFFGDVVSQHGGTIWLGSLIEAIEPFGINERLVRTSVFRLAQDDWLEARRAGRRSYYRLSRHGTLEYERAARRIYAADAPHWTGDWQLVLPVRVAEERREELRKSLLWQGFRPLATGMYALPGGDRDALDGLLAEHGAEADVLVMNAGTAEIVAEDLVREVVAETWRLDAARSAWEEFLSRFRPLLRRVSRSDRDVEPAHAFVARLLLVHDYRRLVLAETRLPEELLPPRWPGAEARGLAATLYERLTAPSLRHIGTRLEGERGPLEARPAASFHERFQGR